jgi:hypothetical protein
MWGNFVGESTAPTWGLLLVLACALLIGVAGTREIIPRLRVRILFVVLLITAGILTTASGPLVQSLFEDISIWGTPFWGLHYFRSLDLAHGAEFLASLLKWGILPGGLCATAAVALRGWLRKVLGSGIVAAVVFITLDLVVQSRNSAGQLDVGYIINVNVAGGALAGLVVGSLGYLGEQLCLRGFSPPWRSGRTSTRTFLVSPLLVLVALYLCWYFFLDHPATSVWLRMGKWDLVDLSQYGDSLEVPLGLTALGNEQWASFTVRSQRSASIYYAGALRLIPAQESIATLADSDPTKAGDVFRKLKPMALQKAEQPLRLEGDGDVLYLVKEANEKMDVSLSVATFDFLRVQRRDAGGCTAVVLGRSLGETMARLNVFGKYPVYVSFTRFAPQARPFAIAAKLGGAWKALYARRTNQSSLHMESDGPYLSLSTQVSDLAVSDCDSAVQWMRFLDYFRGEPGEGVLRVGIDSYDLNSGDRVLLAKGLLESRSKDGAWVLQGTAKEVWINNVRINRSRWGRTSIELKSTLVASLIGALGASIGWFLRKRQVPS